MYVKYVKRALDFIISFLALILLLPLMILLAVTGALVLRGNPFFTQKRPGKKGKDGREKIFTLIKFRTMTNKRDSAGNLLPDEERMTKYGTALRASSLDELPEFFNIIKGDMSLVGPRPLLVEYLPRYTELQRRRHNVMPGLTGYAQVHGRNDLDWDEKFAYDLYYVEHISFKTDVRIVADTVKAVIFRQGITDGESVTMAKFTGEEKTEKIER